MKKTMSSILAVVLLFAFASTASAQITKDQYYARSTLSGNELEYYDDLYDAIKDGHGLYGSGYGLTEDRAYEITIYLYGDAPEMYGGYAARDSMFNTEKDRIDTKTEEVLSLLSDNMTDYEKVKTVYKWLARNIEHGESKEAGDEGKTIVGTLVYGKGVCVGLSSTLQYLLYKVDIPCYTVTGTFEGGAHAWNIIQIDGQWYNADLTDNARYPGGVFLFGDEIFNESHQADPDLNPPLPECPENYVEQEPTSTPTIEATPEPTITAEVTGEPTNEAVEAREAGPGDAVWYALGGAAAVAAVVLIIWAVRRKKKQK